ncbi:MULTISPECIES: Dabb family protein [Aquitalea]|uniref:Dabb family protein n=1 Tax=Aquitalea TaxID=407217 RepID=UPI001356CEC0|nr:MULTISPECIES: Dabb family protein [Aquitalea]
MLQHIVLFRFVPSCKVADLCCISQRFSRLAQLVPDILSLSGGADCSPEGLQHGFTHGWLLQFADTAARDAYLTHPAHLEFINFIQPFVDDVLVSDFPAR